MPKFAVSVYGAENLDAVPTMLVELDAATCGALVARIAVVKGIREKDDTLYGMDYHDYTGEWFDLYSLDGDLEEVADLQDRLASGNIIELKGDLLAHVEKKCEDSQYDGGAQIRTECNIMTVCHDGVLFTAYPKHTSIRMETSMLSMDLLKQFATED